MKLFLAENRNIRLFYVLAVANGVSFIMGNWIFFWLRYMTWGQLSLVDGLAFAFGLLMEIPTGAVADLVGKKKTLMAAMLLSTIGALAMSFSGSATAIFGFFLIWQVGMALYSGAVEAFAYDTLIDIGEERHFDQVIATQSMLAIITSVVTVLVGMWLYSLHFRLSHIAWGLAYLVGFIATIFLSEPNVETEKFSWYGYFIQLRDGTKHLFQPALRRFLPLIFTLTGVYFFYFYGFIRPAIAISFDFNHETQSVIFAVISVVAGVIIRVIPWLRTRVSDMRGLLFLATLLGGGFLAAAFPIGHYGFWAMFAIGIAGRLTLPWVSIVVNKHLESKYRATALSVIALVTRIPYAIIAITAGQLVEQGHLPAFNSAVAIIVFAILVISMAYGYFCRLWTGRDRIKGVE